MKEENILLHENSFHAFYVHSGKCLAEYNKLLTEPAAVRRGFIIGICTECGKPVRCNDRFVVSRICLPTDDKEDKYHDNTTLPSKDTINFIHNKCTSA
jgi:hypothetical protein